MQYTPKNIDIDAFEKALDQVRQNEYRRLETEKMKATAYYEGYEDCISQVKSMGGTSGGGAEPRYAERRKRTHRPREREQVGAPVTKTTLRLPTGQMMGLCGVFGIA